ncbi:hypothetical protein EST38_g11407 [Candolleomyces aberdarensis]|uniref:Uncharacterized protein n=1 Tax=Candolleomyces aberdarensis TaxID=2316362 RepID=A0A4Q2D4X5_9AGAR|nr:hypothetical protein EST38_g11407 [Candolleomyces aberdarensis]
MNIRHPHESDPGAYPPPDLDVLDFIRSIPSTASGDEVIAMFRLLFKALFKWVANELDTLSYPDTEANQFASKWREHLQSRRQTMYREVSREVQDALFSRRDTPHEAFAALKTLIGKVPAVKNGAQQLSVFMYVDEAQTLDKEVGGSTLYELLIKALNFFRDQSFFVLFVSTVTRDHSFVEPPLRLAPPGRMVVPEIIPHKLLAPYTEMPFDCHETFPLSPGMKLEEIQGIEFLIRFGRPLFWAFFESVPNKTEIQALAIRKITRSPKFELDSLATGAKLAVLEILLNLEYRPLIRLHHGMVKEMVAGHMRTIYSAPRNRQYLHSGYPSEPVLAEAAMEILHRNESGALDIQVVDAAAELLVSLDSGSTKCAIDMGGRSETVGRMILLRAYMNAVKESCEEKTGIDWSMGCSLVSFLKHLTADGFHGTVLGCKPDNVGSRDRTGTLETAFGNAWIRFTHFVRGVDDTAVTTCAAWPAFLRSMAFICSNPDSREQSVDVCIPVLLDKAAPIEEENMSIIAVQFKRRVKGAARRTYTVDAQRIKVFPPLSSTSSQDEKAQSHRTRPYISLVMELCARDSAASVGVVALDPPVRTTTGSGGDNIHPRYSLVFYGCSSKVYGCISEESDDDYERLLRLSGNEFADHPRASMLSKVMAMQPGWEAAGGSYGWAQDEWLQNPTDDG